MSFKIEHIALGGGSLTLTIDASDDPKRIADLHTALANLALSSGDEIVDALLGLRATAVAKGVAQITPAPSTQAPLPLSNEQPYVDATPTPAAPAEPKKRAPRLAAVPAPVSVPAVHTPAAVATPTAVAPTEPPPSAADPMDAADEAPVSNIPEGVLKATKMREVVTTLHETYGYTDAEQFAEWAKIHAKDVPFFATMPNAVDRARAAGKMLLQGG